ncbi:MAG: AI-2E family transporter [Planctomycetes bacterium]|nr:AI-2E family transporter [Planctomycetota bacterium]
MKQENVNRFVILLFVFFISAVFLSMIRQFLMAIFLAGIFSALAHPFYLRLKKWFGGRRALASFVTLMLIILLVLIPFITLLGIVTAQAIKVGESVMPWIQKQHATPAAFTDFLKSMPFYDQIEPYRNLIFEKAGEIVSIISGFLINSLSSATMGTANFIFMAFIMLYTMFFFLMDGDQLLDKILYYLPLQDKDERRLLNKFTSVTRASLRGTVIIGIVQGALGGLAFAAVGIPSAVFWATIMAVLSIIPALGATLVWGPAAIILVFSGNYMKAAGLTAFCGLVVGLADNFLRPRLVGKDTEMHDLLILFGTLGGIAMFGVMGIIIGPILAALFTTIWEIYGITFKEYLQETPTLQSNNENSKPDKEQDS